MQKPEEQPAIKVDEYSGERDMDLFWKEIKPLKEPTQVRWFVPAVLALLVLSVPWYLPAGFVGRLVGGLPPWIWVSVACATSIAAITSYVALRSWEDDEE